VNTILRSIDFVFIGMRIIILCCVLFITSCTRYKIRVVQYDGTGYSLYMPMKRYGLDTWRDDNIIYYSEQMAKHKIHLWKTEEYYLNPFKKPEYIKVK
jgi:hypothetical protein